MAGYRPKSLDELNSIFDKTIAAEKAIRKGSSLLEKGEDSFSSFSVQAAEDKPKTFSAEEKPSEEITDSVSDFIAKFTVQTQAEPVKAKPQMTVIAPEPVKKEYEILNEAPTTEAQSTPTEAEKPSRDELFDEYMKIMSDEDDDAPAERKLSRKEKKRLRKKEKAERKNTQASEAETEPAPEEATDPVEESVQQEAEPSEEESVKDESISFESAEETAAEEDSQEAFSEPISEEASEQDIPEEKDDFKFPENYTPEWIKENEDDGDEEDEEKEKLKPDYGKIIFKVILTLVLIAVISAGTLATLLKTVVAPNTGKLVADKYYVFTTYKDYTDIGIAKDTLIITEKKYAAEGEFFVYVDYANKTFELGKRTDSITKEDGEVLYVTERDGGRTLVSRDDCKGVIYLTYADRGGAVSFLTDNYIIIVAAAAVISLVIVLVFALVLRGKRDEDYEIFEEELSEEEEENFDDIFSTIE